MLVVCLVYMVLSLLKRNIHCREWVLFGIMSFSAIGIWAATFTKPKDHRANGTCNAILLTVAAFSYYAMVGLIRLLRHYSPQRLTKEASSWLLCKLVFASGRVIASSYMTPNSAPSGCTAHVSIQHVLSGLQ